VRECKLCALGIIPKLFIWLHVVVTSGFACPHVTAHVSPISLRADKEVSLFPFNWLSDDEKMRFLCCYQPFNVKVIPSIRRCDIGLLSQDFYCRFGCGREIYSVWKCSFGRKGLGCTKMYCTSVLPIRYSVLLVYTYLHKPTSYYGTCGRNMQASKIEMSIDLPENSREHTQYSPNNHNVEEIIYGTSTSNLERLLDFSWSILLVCRALVDTWYVELYSRKNVIVIDTILCRTFRHSWLK